MRRLQIKGFGPAILSDTVGFIQGLPHTLVDAFMSTLEEVSNADLLLRVADDNDPEVMTHESEVETVLSEIGAAEIPTIVVRNKCDLSGKSPLQRKAVPDGRTLVRVSAQTGLGIEGLLEEVFIELSKFSREVIFSIPPSKGRLRAQIFSLTEVLEESVDQDGISHIRARADAATIGKIKRDPDYCVEFLDFEQKFNDDNQRCEGGEDVSSYSTVINSG
jgi:GTP-binding protein HflX